MSSPLVDRAPARPRRRPALLVLGAILLTLVVVLALAVETRPRAPLAAPDAAGARAALTAGQTLQAFVESGGADGRLSLAAAEVDALLAAAGRLLPGAAAAARLDGGEDVGLTLSLGPPNLPAPFWANLRLDLAAGPQGLSVTRARLGRLPLPPALVERALAEAADRTLGLHGIGREAMAGIVGLTAADGRVDVAFGLDPATRSALVDRLRARLDFGSGENGPVFAQLWWLDKGGDEGALPRHGSVLPYVEAVVTRAEAMRRRWADVPDRDRLSAGFLALAIYCGEPAIGTAVGVTLRPQMRGEGNHCEGTTLARRTDLRRHFLVSAGLYAEGGGAAAFGVGEVKEILDSGAGGTGFSFDDMAANLAGARLAAAFLAAPADEWPAMLALISDESDVMPDVSDLPRGLSEAEFRARFGEVDSPAYRDMLAEIARRVDATPFQRAVAAASPAAR
ncbi:hypothetical protein [Amaricoccus sp.]|uniref:hypothetical protein n=1 Tax=Amaricoccus sp. TaxID=1872485 RepID=UPI001B453B6B|nr:hypothetical protein [Amaricoccus sp.]MBP7001447.1 hypothetical protein [Amaricoccus sp.]